MWEKLLVVSGCAVFFSGLVAGFMWCVPRVFRWGLIQIVKLEEKYM